MISDRTPLINVLNMVIPILMHISVLAYHKNLFVSAQVGILQAACQPMKRDIINYVKLIPTAYRGCKTNSDILIIILSQISNVFQSEIALHWHG